VILTQLTSLKQYPTIVPAMTTEAIEEAQQWTGQVLDHMSNVRQAAYADNMNVANSEYHRTRTVSPYGVWFAPVGDSGSISSNTAGAPGLKTSKYGFMVGYDDEILRGVSAGFATGVDRAYVTENGSYEGSGHVDTPHVDLYTSWWRGPMAIDATLGIALPVVNTNRPVLPGNGTASPTQAGTAYGAYGANEISGGTQASYQTSFDGWAVTGASGVKFLHFTQTQFTENGPTYANFFVQDHMTNSLRPYVEASVSRRFDIGVTSALIPQMRIAYEQEVMSGQRIVNAFTEGDYYNWVIHGLVPGKGGMTVSASLVLETTKDQAYYLSYDRYQSSTSDDQTISAGLRFRM
jgi:hypothetical protein